MAKTVRLSLDLAVTVRQHLEKLKAEAGFDSLAEVIRRALCVYDTMHKVISEGGAIVVELANGEERELMIPEFRKAEVK